MRYLIVSDIHGNFDALESVLADAGGQFNRIVCCGDIVGYGAQPSEVIQWASESVYRIVRGNHDKACCGLDDLEWFNEVARTAALWTQEQLTPAQLEYLAELPQGPLFEDEYMLAHGSPADEDEYLLNDIDVSFLDERLMRKVCFIGHTHLQGGWVWQYSGHQKLNRVREQDNEYRVDLNPVNLYLVNPGSVGQPRDGDPRAAYALFDSDTHTIVYRRVTYDVTKAQNRILRAGLPGLLAHRLSTGR